MYEKRNSLSKSRYRFFNIIYANLPMIIFRQMLEASMSSVSRKFYLFAVWQFALKRAGNNIVNRKRPIEEKESFRNYLANSDHLLKDFVKQNKETKLIL